MIITSSSRCTTANRKVQTQQGRFKSFQTLLFNNCHSIATKLQTQYTISPNRFKFCNEFTIIDNNILNTQRWLSLHSQYNCHYQKQVCLQKIQLFHSTSNVLKRKIKVPPIEKYKKKILRGSSNVNATSNPFDFKYTKKKKNQDKNSSYTKKDAMVKVNNSTFDKEKDPQSYYMSEIKHYDRMKSKYGISCVLYLLEDMKRDNNVRINRM